VREKERKEGRNEGPLKWALNTHIFCVGAFLVGFQSSLFPSLLLAEGLEEPIMSTSNSQNQQQRRKGGREWVVVYGCSRGTNVISLSTH
jgi:hypothetical protein